MKRRQKHNKLYGLYCIRCNIPPPHASGELDNSWLIIGHDIRLVTCDLLTLELVCSVTRCTDRDNRPVDFLCFSGFSSPSNAIVTFDVTAHVVDADHRVPSLIKFDFRRSSPSEETAHFRLSINRHRDLELRPFDP